MTSQSDSSTPLRLALVSLAWLLLFGFTVNVGLPARLLGLVLAQENMILVGAALNLTVLALLAMTRQKETRSLLVPLSRPVLVAYGLLAIIAASVPFHYHGSSLPVAHYLLFTTVSVIWQDYLTFGLLQDAWATRLPLKGQLVVVPLLFATAHLLYIPRMWHQPVMMGVVLLMAVLFTYLRHRTHALHWLIIPHLLFYCLTA